MSKKLVIFDCDGVVVDSEKVIAVVEADYFGASGVPMTAEEITENFRGKTVEDVVAFYEAKSGKSADTQWIYNLAMAVACGFEKDLRPVEGIEVVLQTLQDKDLAFCLASQSPLWRIRLSLQITRTDSFFGENIYNSAMVEKPKPAPDIFLHAAKQQGVLPEHCVVIEDSPTGVAAAVAAGMRVLGYTGETDDALLRDAGAQTFPSMSILPDLLLDVVREL